MENALIALIVAAVIAIIYLLVKLHEQKEYYKYMQNKLSDTEEKSFREIKDLQESVAGLKREINTDITTKIGNRDFFINKTVQMLERSSKNPYTIICFSISNIDLITKLFGPAEGDRLIRYTAEKLKERYQSRGLYALIQSNMFAMLLKGHEDVKILEVIRDISEDIANCFEFFNAEAVFGIYKIDDPSVKVSEMLSRVALAQRSVSTDAKENYAFFDMEMSTRYEENRNMCLQMEQALEQKEFVMYLQPLVDLHEYKIVNAEALVRWEHKEKGLLSPYAFLPIFENTNLMLKLDYYMWEEACKTVRRWIDNKLEVLPLMINISPIHLSNDGFIQLLNELVEKYRLKKDMFILEISERGLTNGESDVFANVKNIAENGYKLCVDNFGGLHLAVNILRILPISMIKLDKRFLDENSESEEGETILRYLIAMAKEMELTVIIEGIETQEQVDFVTEIGCDIAQGYFFSKAVSLRDFDSLNKKIKRQGFRPGVYYPTISDLEKNIDILEKMTGISIGEKKVYE